MTLDDVVFYDSVGRVARNIGRHLRRVQADVIALEAAGLIDRSHGAPRRTG